MASATSSFKPHSSCGASSNIGHKIVPPESPRHGCQTTRRHNKHPMSNSIDIGSLSLRKQVMPAGTQEITGSRQVQSAASPAAAAILSPRYAVRCGNHRMGLTSVTTDCMQLMHNQQQTSLYTAGAVAAAIIPKACQMQDDVATADSKAAVLDCDSSDSETNVVVEKMRHTLKFTGSTCLVASVHGS